MVPQPSLWHQGPASDTASAVPSLLPGPCSAPFGLPQTSGSDCYQDDDNEVATTRNLSGAVLHLPSRARTGRPSLGCRALVHRVVKANFPEIHAVAEADWN